MDLGTLRARYVEVKLSVQPHIKRKINRETLAIGNTDIVLQNVYV